MDVYTTLVQCTCLKETDLPHNKLQDGNSILPKELSHSSCHCAPLHHDNGGLKGPMSSHRPESHSSLPCARSILKAVAWSPPCTTRKIVTVSFRFNCTEPNSSWERRARTNTSSIARNESFVHPHSNDQSVSVYLRSIPFCARYLSIVSVVLLTAPAVSTTTSLSL